MTEFAKPKFNVFVGGTDDYARRHARTFGEKCDACGEPKSFHEPEGFVAYPEHGLLSCSEILLKKVSGVELE